MKPPCWWHRKDAGPDGYVIEIRWWAVLPFAIWVWLMVLPRIWLQKKLAEMMRR